MTFDNLDEDSNQIKQPKGLKVKLRPHQLTSIYAMKELEKQGTIIIDKPDIVSGLYQTVKSRINDIDEFTQSTFVLETNAAILADKVGAGKTFMIVGLILNSPKPISHDRLIVGTDNFSIKMMGMVEAVDVNLIVVPHGLTIQWSQFMKKSKIKFLELNGISDFDIFFDIDYVTENKKGKDDNGILAIYSKTRKKNVLDTKSKKGSKTKEEIIYQRKVLNFDKVQTALGKYKAFVLNVNRYKFFKEIFQAVKWSRVIVDEMDSITIPTSFDEFGNFNWFLTATPTSIFYKSCRRYVNKIFGYYRDLLPYFTIKNKDEYVDSSMVLPRPDVFVITTLLQRVVSAIKDLIPADVLQLINAGNMKEAVAKLNCDIDTEENIVKVLSEKINNELHNLKQELGFVQALIPNDEDAHEKRIQNIKDNIAKCKLKLDTIKERINGINDECCFICTEAFVNPAVLECCKSVFCLECLIKSLKSGDNKCPYCRHTVKNNKEYHVISKDPIKKTKDVSKITTKNNDFEKMDKADALEKILMHISKKKKDPKILIFSDFSQTFDKIINNIAKAGLQYALLSGVPAHMNNVINEFKAGVTNILMLDSQHYGSGLNLQDAEYLIMYHRMTPELETQVIGRAQRYGRTESLVIIYLVNSSENQQIKITTKTLKPTSTGQLWMITDPPRDEENDDKFEENIDSDSDSDMDNIKSEENVKSKSKSKSNSKSNSKSKSKSKKATKESEESEEMSEKETDTDSESSANTKSKSKSKKISKKISKKQKKKIVIISDPESDNDSDIDLESKFKSKKKKYVRV